MANVLLLRARSQEQPDKYEEAFRRGSYYPISVPVLETVLKNLPDLEDVARKGQTDETYAGVVITSARSCEAWREIIIKLASESNTGQRARKGWSEVPFYVVGEATASALLAIQAAFPSSPYAPHDIRGGKETGTSEKLAQFIVSDLSPPSGNELLYLTGDKNRDTLPAMLSDAGFKLHSLQVYETRGSAQFHADLKTAVAAAPDGKWWIVYFAPSAADFVTPYLERHFGLARGQATIQEPATRQARVAAIGPTTSTFLRDQLGLLVDAVPTKPNPEALLGAISQADDQKLSKD